MLLSVSIDFDGGNLPVFLDHDSALSVHPG
jgi:hypothetical protein